MNINTRPTKSRVIQEKMKFRTFENKISSGSRYRWILLASTCMCQLLGIGYMSASVNIYPIYYEDRFGDRKMAGQIGSVGLSLSFLACKYNCVDGHLVKFFYYVGIFC